MEIFLSFEPAAASLTGYKRSFIRTKSEAVVGGGWPEETRCGTRRGGGSTKQTTRPSSNRVGRALSARLVILQPQFLQEHRKQKQTSELNGKEDSFLDQCNSCCCVPLVGPGLSRLTSRDLFSYSFMAVMHWCLVLMLVVTPAFTIVSFPVGG